MAPKSASVTLLLLALASSAFGADYFRLVLVWPGGYCSVPGGPDCCLPYSGYPKFDFLINRMVPYTGNAPSTQCSSAPFYINALQNNITDLNNYWPSIKCPSNDGTRFWESVWNSDGRCSGLDQRRFFLSALDLRRKANVIDILDWKSILPTNYATYALSEVERAINEVFGVTTYIDCGSKTSNRILGLHLCVDGTATNIIKCPFTPASNCAPQLNFYPFTADLLKEKYSTGAIKMPVSE